MQGITTFVGGNCGSSICCVPGDNRDLVVANLETTAGRPLKDVVTWRTPDECFTSLERRGLLLNCAMLAAHGTLRIAASGLETRFLTPDELGRMERLLAEALDMGCLGMSCGLQYFPGSQSDQHELAACGRVLKERGGVLASHLRSYAHTLDLALDEVLGVARECGIPLQISHLYWLPYRRGMAGATRAALRAMSFAHNRIGIPIPIEAGLAGKVRRIEAERAHGTDVRFDLVPSSQGFMELSAILPPYALQGSRAETMARLSDAAFRARLRHDVQTVEPDWPHREGATWSFNYIKMAGWPGLRVMSAGTERNRWMEGLSFPDIARRLERDPLDAVCDLMVEEQGRTLITFAPTFPDDPLAFRSLRAGFTSPLSVPATDTLIRPVARPSHVFYDCFPRFLQHFVRREHVFSWEEAVRKATSLPAAIMGIRDRGLVREGFHADLLVFDPQRIGTSATFDDPARHPTGIRHVLVNGRAVVDEGRFVEGVLAGDVVRKAPAA